MNTENRKAITLKAHRLLQAKVGTGLIKEELVQKAQKQIDSNKVDFAPMAKEYLDLLKFSIEAARKKEKEVPVILQEMTEAIMQVKANASMFDYGLVGNLANVMLNFMETIEDIDSDVIDIVDAHYKTLVVIIGNEMKGDGGEYGVELTSELKKVCKRYFTKYSKEEAATKNNNTFFVDD